MGTAVGGGVGGIMICSRNIVHTAPLGLDAYIIYGIGNGSGGPLGNPVIHPLDRLKCNPEGRAGFTANASGRPPSQCGRFGAARTPIERTRASSPTPACRSRPLPAFAPSLPFAVPMSYHSFFGAGVKQGEKWRGHAPCSSKWAHHF